MKVVTERTLKHPEVLTPVGALEKLKVAICYGTDAIYVEGNACDLHNRVGNSMPKEMAESVAFAREYDTKVYVAANMVTHGGNQEGAEAFFRGLRDIGISAVIAPDPALIEICATEAPGPPIRLLTQASTTNYEMLESWKNEGLERMVLAHGVSMGEVTATRKNTDAEIEALIRGAVCISYSGRYTLPNRMSMRDVNRGGCSQSCRWKCKLFDIPSGAERRSKTSEGEVEEELLVSAVDMPMIEHIPGLIESGVDSFRIGGRMKSTRYVSVVANVYKKAADSYIEDPGNYVCQQEWIDELWKVARHELATGFCYNTPSKNEQLFDERRRIPQYKFVGKVIAYNGETQAATIRQRNLLSVGDEIEFYGPGSTYSHQAVEEIYNEDGEAIDRAPNPMVLLTMEVAQPVTADDMIRKKR